MFGDFVCVGSGSTLTIYKSQCATTTAVSDPDPAPVAGRLLASIPNPFRQSTVIGYQLFEPSSVSLRIYDLSGRLVRVLEDRTGKASGEHRAVWNGRDDRGRHLPAGVYFYRLDAPTFTASDRAVLME